MTSHMRTPYGAPTHHLKGNPFRRYETVIIRLGGNTDTRFPRRTAFTTQVSFLANSRTVTVIPCTVSRTLTFEPVTNSVSCKRVRYFQRIHTIHTNIQIRTRTPSPTAHMSQ